MYATAIIDNVQFKDSLVAQDLMCRYLQSKGSYSECTTRGMACLRQLKIDIPPTADQESIVSTMQETAMILSQYTTQQITNLKNPETAINSRKQQIIYSICNHVMICCFRESSPFLPLLSCLMVQYILIIKWFGGGISHCVFGFRLPSHSLNGESKLCGQLSCLICLFLSTSHVHLLFMPKQDNFDLAKRCGEISESILTKADPSAHLFVSRLDFLTFISSTF